MTILQNLLPPIDRKLLVRKLIRGFLVGLAIFVLLNTAFSLNLFASWQERLSDSLFIARKPDPNIVIIAIDDKSIAKIGRFPWDRSTYAKLLTKLSDPTSKPASIGLDISFFEKSNDQDDQALADALKKAGSVTLASEIGSDSQVLLPLDILNKEAKAGIANTNADSSGVTRFAKLEAVSIDNVHYQGFGISVAGTYLANINMPHAYLDNLSIRFPSIRINFTGAPGSFISYPFSDVLNGSVNTRNFKNKIVLIGATASDLHDNQITPTSGNDLMSGVEIQANTIQTLLQQRFLVDESKVMTIVTIFAIAALVSSILVLLPLTPMIILLIILVISYICYIFVSFDHGVIRNIIYPLFTIILVGVANIIYKYVSEIRKKQFVRKAFSFYLSESVLSEVLSHPSKLKLGGERKELTVLFSDVAGFTSISEKLPPEILSHLLNNYLTAMTEIIFKYQGVLDKYIGDAVMAFWGAPIKEPNHALFACVAAIDMYEKVKEIRHEWIKKGVDFDIRIGINTGEMVVGNMGSHQRFDYTLLGDNVNLGSRLEGINKEYGTHIVISESTFNEVKNKVIARKLDIVAVKGKEKGIAIYELIGLKTQNLDVTFLNQFEVARSNYEKGNFKDAVKQFKYLNNEYPHDNPTKIYLERLKNLTKDKPKNWDGIFRAHSK